MQPLANQTARGSRVRVWGARFGCCVGLATLLVVACETSAPPTSERVGADNNTQTSIGGSANTSTGTNTGTAMTGSVGTGIGGGLLDAGIDVNVGQDAGEGGGTSDPDAGTDMGACVEINQEARVVERPVDIIFVIDNSGSMVDEIDQVKARINEDFASIIDASGIDYRVVVFSDFGPSSLEVCVTAPLGADDCTTAVAPVNNPPKLFYYDHPVYSHDSLCLLLDNWDQPDQSGGPPWSEHLRVGAYKVFVEITDDGVNCGGFTDQGSDPNDAVASARAFDSALRALSRDHFGAPLQRTYSWFSIIGIEENVPPDEPWPAAVDGAAAKLQTGQCSTAYSPGLAYQVLSIATGSLRWPVCRNDDFSAMFQAIATNVVTKASVRCDWDLPEPPEGKRYDVARLGVSYQTSDLSRVDTQADCGQGWYVDDLEAPRSVALCSETCQQVRADDSAKLNIKVPCDSLVDEPK